MKIYEWEQNIIDTARTWPTSGFIFESMDFVSDFKKTLLVIFPILIFLMWKKGPKPILIPILLSLVSLALTETFSRRVIKATIMRPRPNFLDSECTNSPCWGFISSHATNIFGIAMLLIMYDRRNIYWALPLAILVSFSRIYLLDHYPMDVIGGAFAGIAIGYIVWHLFVTFQKRRSSKL